MRDILMMLLGAYLAGIITLFTIAFTDGMMKPDKKLPRKLMLLLIWPVGFFLDV